VATVARTTANLVGNVIRVTWTGLTTTNTDGAPIFAPDHTIKDVQVFGTFGAGGSVRIQGSLDGETTWAALNDVQGNALNISAAAIEKIQETSASVRPLVTAGDGTTSLTVVMILKMANTADS